MSAKAHDWIGESVSDSYCRRCGRDARDGVAVPCERPPGAKLVQRPDGSRAIDCKLDFDGDVIREDGSVNWAAAFAADDGVGDCAKCGHWVGYHPCWHETPAPPEGEAR